MKLEDPTFSPQERAAQKVAARARDEEQLRSGKVAPAKMARINGGSLRGSRYKGPSKRIQALARKTTLASILDDLNLTKPGLADVLGVSLQDLDESLPLSSQALPQQVRDFVEIIAATVRWEGSSPQALAWFSNCPLPSLGNQTAADLLRLGRADAVKSYLERIDHGGYT